MSPSFALEPAEWDVFSLPQSLRLAGEYLYIVGAGTISVATTLRLRADVRETAGPFAVDFGRWADSDEGWVGMEGEEVAAAGVAWEQAICRAVALEKDELRGLRVRLDFGHLADICPTGALTRSPAAAVALATAVAAFRREGEVLTAPELAEAACEVLSALDSSAGGHLRRSYPEALTSVTGGVGYVEPGAERLNVQTLLPPGSLLLALRPGLTPVLDGREPWRAMQEAVASLGAADRLSFDRGDEGLARLFELGRRSLSDEHTGMLYGLHRVREMTEAYVELLGDPVVDNDRLAELCDEESEIMADYFGFPAAQYAAVRTAAVELGALGAKFTWAFGSYPAVIIVAPGDRDEIGRELAPRLTDVRFLPVNAEPTGLKSGEYEPEA